MHYDHKKIEEKWQKRWLDAEAFAAKEGTGKKKFYVLDMFPYPSGAGLHVGHVEGYTATDIYSRYKRMQGFEVLHPMGWDAFGLPAENYAIKTGIPPAKTTNDAINTFRRQIQSLGLSYDWSREIGTHTPEYYTWTQWFFLFLYKHGLAEKKVAKVNWDPVDQTVLANEQVLPDGTAERSGAKVVQKDLDQWFFKITDFADALVDDLDTVDWPESTKINQRNWIGRSEGAEIDFPLNIEDKKHVVFLHCKGGSPEKDFIPWAKAELEKRGYTVEAPELPNTNEPDDIEQAEFVKKNCRIDENTIVIGHSAGGLAALRLLETTNAGRLVLVATPFSPTFRDGKERPTVARSIQRGYDWGKIRANVQGILALYDRNDHVVTVSDGEAYAEKLGAYFIRGLGTKTHFNGAQEPDVLMAATPTIRVFTTRPDTLFGATYMVLAPEHPWVTLAIDEKHGVLQNKAEVHAYVEAAKNKTDLDRQSSDTKEKTGVELKGVKALNPATKEEIPLFVADYVLGSYGTGAIMAVPAHDERDWEFAKKFDVLIRPVVLPRFYDDKNPPLQGKENTFRKTILGVVYDPKQDKYLCLVWKEQPWVTFISGGIEEGEDAETAARREVAEETGYTDLKFIRAMDTPSQSEFYAAHKGVNRTIHGTAVLFELRSNARQEVSPEEAAKYDIVWLTQTEVSKNQKIAHAEMSRILTFIEKGNTPHTGEGVLINSGQFDGMRSEDAKKAITEFVGGKITKTYKLRDWLVSRQRYWGAPIPIVYDPEGKPHPIPEEHLPWMLPTDVEFKPTGTSPLGQSKELLERTEKIFGKGWRPEVDTLDTFVCSSWYYYRFADPKNEHEFASKKALEQWLPVDLYVGGAEHTVLHLMYARFFTKALQKHGYISFSEPFLKLRHQGIILAEDSRKMSKRYGNVINPDDVVERFGADTLRLYEMFMGPLEAMKPWNSQNILGVRRFLERTWSTSERIEDIPLDDETEILLNQTIQKVGDDLEQLKMNTAVSALMILLNHVSDLPKVPKRAFIVFLQLLAPLAPHITHELAETLDLKREEWEVWPKADTSKLVAQKATVAVQINGKVRATIEVSVSASQEEVLALARQEPTVAKWLSGGREVKAVYVPGRVVNFAIEAV